MVVLSDAGMKKLMEEGRLSIEPFNEDMLGPMSYDLTLDRLFVSVRPHPAKELAFEEFLAQCCEPIDAQLVEPGRLYFGLSREKITSDNTYIPDATARSSAARVGLEIAVDSADFKRNMGRVPFIIRSVSEAVVVPFDHPIAQLSFRGLLPLYAAEIAEALKKGEIYVSGKPQVYRENKVMPIDGIGYSPTADALLLHLGRKLKRFRGGIIDPLQDTDGQFEEMDISEGYVLRKGGFYLGHTQEHISIGIGHAGRLVRFFHSYGSEVHLNAPWVQPGSSGNQVLEMTVMDDRVVRAGWPVCGMEIHALDQPAEKSYNHNGRYANQSGPLTSRLHSNK